MNKLNFFSPCKSRIDNNEDELIRAFFITLKYVPSMQSVFFSLINEKTSKYIPDRLFPEDTCIEDFFYQVRPTDKLFDSHFEDKTVAHIVIVDDQSPKKDFVTNSLDKQFNGIIFTKNNYGLIIENNPGEERIWLEKVKSVIPENRTMDVISNTIHLSWKSIVYKINDLVSSNMLEGLERVLVQDFLEFIESEYRFINPYTTFHSCENNIDQLNKRCVYALSKYKNSSEIQYQDDMRPFIYSGKKTVEKLYLDVNDLYSNWAVNLWMYAGNSLSTAYTTYENLDLNGLFELRNKGYEISKNIIIQHENETLLIFKGDLFLEEYLRFWKNEYKIIEEHKITDLIEIIDTLKNRHILLPEENAKIKELVSNNNYEKLSISPGFLVKYTWNSKTAKVLDKINQFNEDFESKVSDVFEVIGNV
ncbi:hypothetical protein SAMN02745751_00891 [Dethiosulfatibacter aminovorans DSM 17477]|uniref:Uncharacterized protein n=1 Tax=Dethiosulfatibacter aminovorans DSM 17477 TaxID=1121476 RepID=A0A1M6DFS0_9FIRM|nr:hypothetical protein [Dethiosulfatibacter aminovorans]SHI71838.1 hypothetical protein SAMN02745751_00891 [Dethiosulfatibacter aminovorans DSM 17477]